MLWRIAWLQSWSAACSAGLGLAMYVSARLRPMWHPSVSPIPLAKSSGRSAVVNRSGVDVLPPQSAEVSVCVGLE